MAEDGSLTRATLKTPRAAAVAGILFAGLTIAAFVILRTSERCYLSKPKTLLAASMTSVS